MKNEASFLLKRSRLSRAVGTPSLTGPNLTVTIFFEVVADTLIVGGLGSRGEVRRLSGMKFTSEAQASGRGVGVDVGVAGGIDVGGGVWVGVG